jgi:lipopolysaccharide transport system ATP-binding protein
MKRKSEMAREFEETVPASPVISLSGIRKDYVLGETPGDRLRAAMGFRPKADRGVHHALAGVSLEIERGETVGLIGSNGAGKSTLLQVVTGTLKPTSGVSGTRGRVSALLELGAGFNPEWTGRRNAEFQCIIQGVPSPEIKELLDGIEQFADIGAYFDEPTRTYSSGMFLRVAFAAAVATEPDILIVDEALAVGDVRFQNKCYARFLELQKAGATIIFVTHSLELVKRFCTRGIVLDKGRISFDGDPGECVAHYLNLLHGPGSGGSSVDTSEEAALKPAAALADIPKHGELTQRAHYNPLGRRTGKGFAEILDFQLCDDLGQDLPAEIASGREVRLRIWAQAKRDITHPFFGWIVKATNETHIYGSNTKMSHIEVQPMAAGETAFFEIPFRLSLASGSYFFDLGVGEIKDEDYVSGDWRISLASLYVSERGSFFGLASLAAIYQ